MRIRAPSHGCANPVTGLRDAAWPQVNLRTEVLKERAANHLINQQNDVSVAFKADDPQVGL